MPDSKNIVTSKTATAATQATAVSVSLWSLVATAVIASGLVLGLFSAGVAVQLSQFKVLKFAEPIGCGYKVGGDCQTMLQSEAEAQGLAFAPDVACSSLDFCQPELLPAIMISPVYDDDKDEICGLTFDCGSCDDSWSIQCGEDCRLNNLLDKICGLTCRSVSESDPPPNEPPISCIRFCDRNPTSPYCKSTCFRYPDSLSCGSYCRVDPTNPICNQYFEICSLYIANNYCEEACANAGKSDSVSCQKLNYYCRTTNTNSGSCRLFCQDNPWAPWCELYLPSDEGWSVI